jgi:hypothetical protein
MSNAHVSSNVDPSDDDGINLKKIVAVGVVSLVIFAASAVIAGVILDADVDRYKERGVAPRGSQLGKAEIGIVDTVEFEGDHRLDVWRAEKARALGSFGWVDRAKGTIHIPIAQAMDEVVRQAQTTTGGGQ